MESFLQKLAKEKQAARELTVLPLLTPKKEHGDSCGCGDAGCGEGDGGCCGG